MTVESVRAYLREHGLEYEIHEFGESTETVELAAQALGVESELIAKTLAFAHLPIEGDSNGSSNTRQRNVKRHPYRKLDDPRCALVW
jgi:hypothetical protein